MLPRDAVWSRGQKPRKGNALALFTTRRSFVLGAAAATALTGGRTLHADEDPMLTVSGELTYLQRIALPGGSVAAVEIRTGEGLLVADTRIELDGAQVPVPFTLDLTRRHIGPDAKLTLQGAILQGPLVRWLTEPVAIEPGASPDLGMLVMAMQEAPSPAEAADLAAMQSGEWRIAAIADETVPEGASVTIAFDADAAFHGRACNGFRGFYRVNGRSLTLGRGVSTLMACDEPLMSQENALFAALQRIAGFGIEADGALALTDAAGANLIVARQ